MHKTWFLQWHHIALDMVTRAYAGEVEAESREVQGQSAATQAVQKQPKLFKILSQTTATKILKRKQNLCPKLRKETELHGFVSRYTPGWCPFLVEYEAPSTCRCFDVCEGSGFRFSWECGDKGPIQEHLE